MASPYSEHNIRKMSTSKTDPKKPKSVFILGGFFSFPSECMGKNQNLQNQKPISVLVLVFGRFLMSIFFVQCRCYDAVTFRFFFSIFVIWYPKRATNRNCPCGDYILIQKKFGDDSPYAVYTIFRLHNFFSSGSPAASSHIWIGQRAMELTIRAQLQRIRNELR